RRAGSGSGNPCPARWPTRPSSRAPRRAFRRDSRLPRSGGLNDAAPQLIALERFEQRLEVAFAEALVALALDELEEHGTEEGLREDLQEQPLLAALGGSVQEDPPRLQLVHFFVVSGQALLEHLVVGLGRSGHQRDTHLAQAVDARMQIVGEERDVLDALA